MIKGIRAFILVVLDLTTVIRAKLTDVYERILKLNPSFTEMLTELGKDDDTIDDIIQAVCALQL